MRIPVKAPEGGRVVLLGAALFTAFYYGLRLWLGGHWLAEASLLLPPAFVTAAHLRRAGKEAGRARWFFRLTGAAAAIWMVAEVLWAGAIYFGADPASPAEGLLPSSLDALFIGFLVPVIGAVALGPHPRRSRWDGVALADTALIVTTITFVFIRVVFLPFARVGGLESTRGLLLASETWLLAVWTAALWRGVQDRAWKRTYGLVSVFAFSYGVLSSLANGSGGEMPAAGGPLDVAWIFPLFALGAAALPGLSATSAGVSGPFIAALAGSGPLALDLLVDRMLPQVAGPGHAAHILLLLPVSALLALGCAIRLLVEEQAEARAVSEGRALAEAERRAGRLSALASMSASVVAELERAMEEVVAHAGRAASALGDKGGRVLSQALRAQAIVRDMVGAMSLVRPGPRREIDLGTLLEETALEALDEGMGLQISLQGLAGLPPVLGDPGALGAAFVHLVRNAAQASPGGVLRVAAARHRDEVLLSFTDDGPGVPPEVRHRIFDPFFSTRRVGEGVGLGLTLVHSVARDHGGAVVLEPGEGGATFSVRLPVSERQLEAPGWPHWPFAAAVLGSAAIATTLAVIPGVPARSLGSALFQVASAVTAAAALGWTALRRRGRERDFWLLLAFGPAIWAAVRFHGLVVGVATSSHVDGRLILDAAADWAWVAALLLRPDRRRTGPPSPVALLGAGAACSLFGYFYAYVVILPAPMAALDPALAHEILLARGIQRLAIAAWAATLSWRVLSPWWRGLYSRLAIVFAAWAIGHTLATLGPTLDSYRPGQILDLGWIVPFLLLGALGVKESLLGTPEEPRAALASHSPPWGAVSLAALAAIPAFDALVGPSSHPALDAMRATATRVAVIVLGLLLAWREVLTRRQAGAERALLNGTRTQLLDAERRARLLGSAVNELGGHLSGITALVRLLLAQNDLSGRVRGDVSRIHTRAETAGRILRNLLGLVRRPPETLEPALVNDVIQDAIELRSSDLAQEGIRVAGSPGADIPSIPLDAAALRQVLLGLVDNAAVALRSAGKEGAIVVSSALEGSAVVVRVSDGGPGIPEATLRQVSRSVLNPHAPWTGSGLGLRLAREVVALHGGTLSARNRPEGGAVLEIRLPIGRQASRAG